MGLEIIEKINKINKPLWPHSSWLKKSPPQTQYHLKSEALLLLPKFPQILIDQLPRLLANNISKHTKAPLPTQNRNSNQTTCIHHLKHFKLQTTKLYAQKG